MGDKSKSIIKSVEKAIQIMKCFNDNTELGVTEISNMLGLHKSTTFGLITTLNANGILERNDDTGKYKLGIELYRLGTKVNLSLREIAIPYLERLVSIYGETANLVILQDTFVIYLEKVESSHSMRISTLVGGKKPVYCTAVGKAIMAFLPFDDLSNLLDRIKFEKYTCNTITNRDALLESLKDIREKGYAEDQEELEIGLYCIATPILNQYKVPFAAISVSGPTVRMENDFCIEVGNALVKFTQEISRKLGYV